MQKSDPDRYAPTREMLNPIATVGVVEPRIDSSHSDLTLYDKEVLKSMGAGALVGTLQGAAASGGQVIAMIFLVPIGLVAGTIGGAVDPITAPVAPSDQQLQATQAMFGKVLTESLVEHKDLQSALITAGNRLSGPLFVPFYAPAQVPADASENLHSPDRLPDALLQVASLNIVLKGSDAKDPRLRLNVSMKLSLSNAESPPRCLGWYAGAWEGQNRRLSAWTEHDGEHLRADLDTAFEAVSQQAVTFLFTPKREFLGFLKKTPQAPSWSQCLAGDPAHRQADVESYCPQADQGIAEYQNRVGDALYNEGDKSRANLIHAYVWYGLAARSNDRHAAERIEILDRMLTPDESKAAREDLRDWKPGQCVHDLAGAFVNHP